MKRIRLVFTAIAFISVVVSPVRVQAQGDIRVLSESAQTDFPRRITFNLSCESDVNLTDIRLNYVAQRESFSQVTSEAYVNFQPAKKVNVSWSLEMVRIGGMPPGTVIDYSWVLKDASGNTLKTKTASVLFDDNRYTWRKIQSGQISLYWYEGDNAFAGEILKSAESALARLSRDTGATLSRPVKLYIYASSRDLLGSMINPQEWTGGVAFTRYGAVAIGIGTGELDWGKSAVVHEFTHLVIGQMTLSPYGDIPRWLDEGLAVYNEGPLAPEFAAALAQVVANKTLISVRSLASPFSALPSKAVLSYAESQSIVNFLINNYGKDKMFELLTTFKEGADYDGALKKVYGFDMDGLSTLWQQSLSGSQKTAEKLPDTAEYDIVLSPLLLLVLASGTRRFAYVRK